MFTQSRPCTLAAGVVKLLSHLCLCPFRNIPCEHVGFFSNFQQWCSKLIYRLSYSPVLGSSPGKIGGTLSESHQSCLVTPIPVKNPHTSNRYLGFNSFHKHRAVCQTVHWTELWQLAEKFSLKNCNPQTPFLFTNEIGWVGMSMLIPKLGLSQLCDLPSALTSRQSISGDIYTHRENKRWFIQSSEDYIS